MIRRRPSLVAVLASFMLVVSLAPAQVAIAADAGPNGPGYAASDDSGGSDPHPNPGGEGGNQEPAPQSPSAAPTNDSPQPDHAPSPRSVDPPAQPAPDDPEPQGNGNYRPSDAVSPAPTAAPSASAGASEQAPADSAIPTPSAGTGDPSASSAGAAGSAGTAPSGESGPGGASSDQEVEGAEIAASASAAFIAAEREQTNTLGGLLAFTGAGAALVLAALTLLVIGLFMLWRSRVEERSLL